MSENSKEIAGYRVNLVCKVDVHILNVGFKNQFKHRSLIRTERVIKKNGNPANTRDVVSMLLYCWVRQRRRLWTTLEQRWKTIIF